MITVNRVEFLRQLETVRAGLSPKETFTQSNCFLFSKGKVMTFNNEVSCRAPTSLTNEIYGCVKAAPLLSMLEKMDVDDVGIEDTDKDFILYGNQERLKIRKEADVKMEIGIVEKPNGTWTGLPEDFGDAINIVYECAKVHDEQHFKITCVHFHPDWVEATDNTQLARYLIKTGVKQSTLVKREAIRHISLLGMTEMTETDTWLHFRNPHGVIMSCRRYLEKYPDLASKPGKGLNASGTPAVLPKGLVELCTKANLYSSETPDNNRIQVRLKTDKLRVRGEGHVSSTEYIGDRDMKYDGPAISFMVSPKLLGELTKKHLDCEICPDALKVVAGKLTYVAWLFSPES
jgi:hypothetical protein